MGGVCSETIELIISTTFWDVQRAAPTFFMTTRPSVSTTMVAGRQEASSLSPTLLVGMSSASSGGMLSWRQRMLLKCRLWV